MKKFSTFSLMTAIAAVTMISVSSCEPFHDGWGDDWGYYDDGYGYGGNEYGYDNGGYGNRDNGYDNQGGNHGDNKRQTYTLSGIWQGTTNYYNKWSGHNYVTSEIEFVPSSTNASQGTGYWVDYYDSMDSTNCYIFNTIEWSIDSDGAVTVNLSQETNGITINSYVMGDNTLTGVINDHGTGVSMDMKSITAPHFGSWSKYSYFDYSRLTDSTTTTESTTTSAKAKAIRICTVSRGLLK